MPKGPTPRQLAREQNIERIKALALTQLAESGAGSLSLRAIARELNLVSSAIYRYYASRDELLTALIVDAYGDLADRLEEAGGARPARTTPPLGRHLPRDAGLGGGRAAPVGADLRLDDPGVRRPAGDDRPGRARGPRALPAAVEDAGATRGRHRLGRTLAGAARRHPGRRWRSTSTGTATLGLVAAFSRVVGLLTLELNGQFVGGFEPADDLFAAWSSGRPTPSAWGGDASCS